MTAIIRNVFDNPILTRELRRRMRGKALIYSIITYITLMTLSTVLVLLAKSPSPFAEANQQMLDRMRATGEGIFLWITVLQGLLVLIVAPTITAGMTTGEKERQTFDFLRVTTITRWMYVTGCFLSTAFYVGLALLCALPLLSLTFLYGGVTLDDVIRMFFTMLGTSCVLSAFGLFISSVCDRTRTAQGIIVFLIFAMVFGGFIVASQVQAIFAGAAAAAATGTSAALPSDRVFIFNIGIPTWVMGVLAMMVTSGIFLLLAARKLFEPDDTRAFAHWQFAVLFLSMLAGYLGFLAANPFTTELPELGYYLAAYAMLLIAVMVFAVGRMEVGDEIWHLKRLFPMLRPIDQTIPFLAATGLVYWLMASRLSDVLPAPVLPVGVANSLVMVSVASFAFFCVLARAMTTFTMQRKKAGVYTAIGISFFLLLIPLVGATMAAAFVGLEGAGRELVAFSPFGIAIDGFRNPNEYPATGTATGFFAVCAYIGLGVIVAIYGETRRFVRWRNFDYHYDMPVG